MIVIHICRNPPSGVWSVVKELAAAQRRNGDFVYFGLLLSRSWPHRDDLAPLGIPTLTVPSPDTCGTAALIYHRLVSRPVHKWLKQLRNAHPGHPISIHYHDAWLSGYLAIKASRLPTAVRQFATFHGVGVHHALHNQPIRRFIHSRMAKRLVPCGAVLISVDRANVPVARNLFSLPNAQFHVVHNGVALPISYAVRSQSLITIGHVSVLREAKGWKLTASAVERLHEKGLPVQLIIAGSGPETETARAWCEKRSKFSRFLGYVANAGQKLIPQLDILCLPSADEGIPMVILEAMAAGVAVVATPAGGVPEVIENLKNGLLVDRTVEALAAALMRLVESPALLEAIQEAAVRRVRDNFTASAMAAGYARLYAQD